MYTLRRLQFNFIFKFYSYSNDQFFWSLCLANSFQSSELWMFFDCHTEDNKTKCGVFEVWEMSYNWMIVIFWIIKMNHLLKNIMWAMGFIHLYIQLSPHLTSLPPRLTETLLFIFIILEGLEHYNSFFLITFLILIVICFVVIFVNVPWDNVNNEKIAP